MTSPSSLSFNIPVISIVIPTYEMQGQGVRFLIRCLNSIEKQEGINSKKIEVVISDQSKDGAIESAIERYPFAFTLRYYRTSSKPGVAAHNLNTAIAHAQGQYVKIVFQDDLLVQTHYLASVLALITEQEPQCLITGAVHTHDGSQFTNPIVPVANPYFLFGYNTISSPSVLTIKRSFALNHPFDESLKMLFDCAFYHEVFSSGAKVIFAPELQIANGIWEGQAQHSISFEQMTREVRYLHRAFPQAGLPQLLPAYQLDFAKRHPYAAFAFSTNLEPTPWEKLIEWCQARLKLA